MTDEIKTTITKAHTPQFAENSLLPTISNNTSEKLHEELERVTLRLRQLESSFTNLFQTNGNSKYIAKIVVKQIETVMDVTHCGIFEYGKSTNTLSFLATDTKSKSIEKKLEKADSTTGPFKKVIEKKKTIQLDSVFELSQSLPLLNEKELERYKNDLFFVFPLLFGGELYGILCVGFMSSTFRKSDYDFMLVFARRCALAIERSRFYAIEKKRKKEAEHVKMLLKEINNAALNFLFPLQPEELYPVIIKEASRILKIEHGSILLAHKKNLERVYSTSPLIADSSISKEGRTYKAFIQQKPLISHVIEDDDINPRQHPLGAKSLIFIPLSNKNQRIGVLNLFSKKESTFTNEELEVLKLFGSMISLSIRKAQLYKETEEAIKMRDLFISLASHELKTPLTVIHLYAQLLEKDVEQGIFPERKVVATLSAETTRLINLINELLQLNQIKTGQLRYVIKRCVLQDIIKRAIADFTIMFPYKLIQFKNKIRTKAYVKGDPDKLLQAFINILNNAAKFSPPHTLIIITLDRINGYYSIRIKDFGSGIPEKDVPKVFQDFYKGSSDKEGMGLGLFIVKKIIDRHEGTIAVRSKINRGTAIEIKLPKAL